MRKAARHGEHHRPRTRVMLFLAADGTQVLDLAGPLQVFARAGELFARQFPQHPPAYRTTVVGVRRDRAIQTSCGLGFSADRYFARYTGDVHTLLVVGGTQLENEAPPQGSVRWVREMSEKAERVVSICTGVFLLAAAGLLEGKRVTTHWKYCEQLAARHPEVQVDPDPIFVRDGRIYTSAGVTAGMDLALSLVEQDLGAQIALDVARELVLFLRRPGGQSQFSAALTFDRSTSSRIRELQNYILNNLPADLSVTALADRAAMSPRHFARIFLQETEVTPAKYVQEVRVEAARRKLELSSASLDEIAAMCGFGSADSLRRQFAQAVGINPSEYRERFTLHRAHASD